MLNVASGGRGCFLDPLGAGICAVEAADVANDDQAVGFDKLAVLSADLRMCDGQVSIPTAADRGRELQGNRAFACFAANNSQFCLYRHVNGNKRVEYRKRRMTLFLI